MAVTCDSPNVHLLLRATPFTFLQEALYHGSPQFAELAEKLFGMMLTFQKVVTPYNPVKNQQMARIIFDISDAAKPLGVKQIVTPQDVQTMHIQPHKTLLNLLLSFSIQGSTPRKNFLYI